MKISLSYLFAAILLFSACKKDPEVVETEAPPVIVGTKGTITGTLRSVTGSPLADVKVAIVGTDLKAQTNSFGIFTFNSVPVGTVKITASHDDFTTIEKDVKIVAGNNDVELKFALYSPISIVRKTDGSTMINDSIYVTFNRPVNVTSITAMEGDCYPHFMTYSLSDGSKTLRFRYNCQKLGGSYPFVVNVKDRYGKEESIAFDIKFYTERIKMPAKIRNYFVTDDNKMSWLLVGEGSTGKVIGVSLDDFRIVKEYTVNKGVNNFAYNSYNKLLYIMTFESLILEMNLETGAIVKELPTDVIPGEPSLPYLLSFAKNGFGLLGTYSHNTSGSETWRIIESDKNDAMSIHPRRDEFKRMNRFTMNEFSKNAFYMYSDRGGDFFLLDARSKEMKRLTIGSPDIGRPIVSSRINDDHIVFKGVQQFIHNSSTNASIKFNSNGITSGDFSYKKWEDDLIYGFNGAGLFTLFNFKLNGMIREMPSIFKTAIARPIATTEGKYLLHWSDDYLYVFNTSMFTF